MQMFLIHKCHRSSEHNHKYGQVFIKLYFILSYLQSYTIYRLAYQRIVVTAVVRNVKFVI